MAIRTLTPIIKEKLQDVDVFVSDMLKNQPLNDGEDRAVFMLSTDTAGVAYIRTVAISGDQLNRVISKNQLREFIENLLTQI